MTIDPGCRLTPRKNVHARRFDDEMIILDLDQGLYFQLDEVGAALWEGMAEGRSLQEVVGALVARYDTSREQLLADAAALAGQLEEAGLVRVEPGGR
jgi:hypothetical protein